jgi:hypothetical protein
MAASTVLSIGNAANRCVSAQRRTAELAGIGPKARPDDNTESEAFRRGRQRGLGRSVPLVKSASNASSALRTTAKPTVAEGPLRKGEPAPKHLGAAEKATPDAPRQTVDPRTEVLRHRGELQHRAVAGPKSPARRECLF